MSPPIFVDGVEMREVFVDGVVQDTVFADGVQVYAAGEDYHDDFLRDPNGTIITSHLMNTGQSWIDNSSQPATSTIQPAIQSGTGNQCARTQAIGSDASVALVPDVGVINESFILQVHFAWQPFSFGVFIASSVVNLGSDPLATRLDITGSIGQYNYNIIINDVATGDGGTFTNLDQNGARLTMYYDGTDIAGEFIVFPSNERRVITRRSAEGAVSAAGHSFANLILPAGGAADAKSCVYLVTETAVAPADMPWPT